MIGRPEYTLTLPPPCPTNRDHLSQGRRARRDSSNGISSRISGNIRLRSSGLHALTFRHQRLDKQVRAIQGRGPGVAAA